MGCRAMKILARDTPAPFAGFAAFAAPAALATPGVVVAIRLPIASHSKLPQYGDKLYKDYRKKAGVL